MPFEDMHQPRQMPPTHYIHFRINGRLTMKEYEKEINALPYPEQIGRLMSASDEILTPRHTNLGELPS